MARYLLTPLIAVACLFAQPNPAFGPTVNGLRSSLRVTEDNSGRWLELTFENVSGKYLYLPLGTIGSGRLESVRLTVLEDEKRESNLVFRTQAGAAPSRSEPLIVPLIPGGRYTWRTSLESWSLPGSRRGSVQTPAVLRAYVQVGADEARRHVNCFGLRIFWTGELTSNSTRLARGAAR